MKLSDQITRRQLFVAFGTSQQTGSLSSVDLAATRSADSVTLTASDGSAAPVEGADASTAGVLTAADKTRLDDLAMTTVRELPARLEIATASVGAAVTHLRTAGYAAAGDGGGALYRRAASEPPHALKVQSADGTWWELAEAHHITFQMCGGIEGDDPGNGAANVTAFNNFIDYLQQQAASGYVKGPTLVFPIVDNAAVYHFSTHLNAKAVVHMTGPAGWHSAAGQGGPSLVFPADSHGLIIQRTDTIDDTTAASTYGADGSVIENLSFQGGGAGNAVGHGVWIRTPATVRNCEVRNFAEDGYHIVGGIGASGEGRGNPFLFRLESCLARANGRHGCFIAGGGANAGHTIGCDFRSNGRWGLYDSSFLGNTHIANHTMSNGQASIAGNGTDEGSIVHYNVGGVDKHFIANVAASEADLVATEPGTDETVWTHDRDAGPTSKVPTWQAGQPAGTYFHGGSYHSDSANAQTLFLNCYDEGDQGPPQVQAPALYMGGVGWRSALGSAGGLMGSSAGLNLKGKVSFNNQDLYDPDRNLTLQFNPGVNSLMSVSAAGVGDGLAFLQWHENQGHWRVRSFSNDVLKITTDLNNQSYGRSAASDVGAGRLVFENGYFMGENRFNIRYRSVDNAPPGSGQHARGDIYWNRDPVGEGAVLGWVCVSPGDPGAWAEIRGVGNQTAGAGQAALTNSTGGTRDGTLAAVSGSGADAAINDNFTELHTLLDEVRTTLVGFGLMKGAA